MNDYGIWFVIFYFCAVFFMFLGFPKHNTDLANTKVGRVLDWIAAIGVISSVLAMCGMLMLNYYTYK